METPCPPHIEVARHDATSARRRPGPRPHPHGLFAQAAAAPDSATRIAKAHTAGRISKAELEREDGVLLYSFDIVVPSESGITEVHVDAMTGMVLKAEHEG